MRFVDTGGKLYGNYNVILWILKIFSVTFFLNSGKILKKLLTQETPDNYFNDICENWRKIAEETN